MSDRECLNKARLALLAPTPAGMEAARVALEEVLNAGRLAPVPARELARVRTLLESAGEFHLGWARFLMGNACGYTAGGHPAMPAPPGTVAFDA